MKGCRQTDVCSQSCSTVGQETGLFFSSPENMVFSFREKKKERKKNQPRATLKSGSRRGARLAPRTPMQPPGCAAAFQAPSSWVIFSEIQTIPGEKGTIRAHATHIGMEQNLFSIENGKPRWFPAAHTSWAM